MDSDFSLPLAKSKSVLAAFGRLNKMLDELHEPVIRELQAILDELPGHSFGSYKENLAVTRELEELLTRLGQCLGLRQGGMWRGRDSPLRECTVWPRKRLLQLRPQG